MLVRPYILFTICTNNHINLHSSLIQAGGAGMLVSANDKDGFKRGENIILGGLILQILIFGFFVVVASIWHVRLQKGPTASSADIPWTKLIWFLYAASVCITIRNLCRVIEYAMGKVRSTSASCAFGQIANRV